MTESAPSPLFEFLEEVNRRPEPFSHYTAWELWTHEHTSKHMLAYHLNPHVDVSSRQASFIDKSAEWLTKTFELGRGKHVADFGCGPGLYTQRLARSGASVTGIDFSERSIDYARTQADNEELPIEYVVADYLTWNPEQQFDLILMIMCDFCVLSPQQRRTLADRFVQLLKPDGRLVLDVYSLTALDKRDEVSGYETNLLDGFWSPDRYYGFLTSFTYKKERVTLDKYAIVEPHQTRWIYNWLQHFSPETLTEELAVSGLEVVDVLGDVAGSPYDPDADEFAVVVRSMGETK